jgi:hypothetical protein
MQVWQRFSFAPACKDQLRKEMRRDPQLLPAMEVFECARRDMPYRAHILQLRRTAPVRG